MTNGMKIDEESVPQIATLVDARGQDCSARQKFLLTRIDGKTSVKELAMLFGLPQDDMLVEIRDLVSDGVVAISSKRADVSSRITRRNDTIEIDDVLPSHLHDDVDERAKTTRVDDEDVDAAREAVEQELLDEGDDLQLLTSRFTTSDFDAVFEHLEVGGADDPPATPPSEPAPERRRTRLEDLPIVPPENWPVGFDEYSEARAEEENGQPPPIEVLLVDYYAEHLGALNHYQLLQLDRDADSSAVVDSASRVLEFLAGIRWSDSFSEEERQTAVRVESSVRSAWETLTHEKDRQRYDQLLSLLDS